VDPVARTVAPANVYKTTNPVATLSVVAGTAAAAPVAPAVPAGALALFEVYVPPLASDSTAFLPVRRAWRQIEFPGTSQHGIVKGGVPVLNTTATPALVSLAAAPSSVHRIVIDGELLSFGGMFINPAQPDSINPPVASGHANFDAPAYLYLCGGRNQPLLNYSSLVPGVYSPLPVALIISLTPPDALGFPTASLATATPTRTFPRAACCYVGLCFCAAGATTNVPAFYAGDFIYSAKTVPTANLKGFLLPGLGATNAFAAYTFAGQPAVSDVVDLSVAYATVPADQGIFSTSSTSAGQFARFLFTNDIGYSVGNKLAINANPFQIYIMSAGGNGTMYVVPAGYNMNVPRLGR
jgi:hypothetical protein